MSNKPRQLLALILALSLSFNLLIASAESAQMSADVSANVSAQTTEKKPEGEPKPETEPEPEPEPEEEPESVQKEDTEAEESQEEEHPEAEPEAEGEESEEEAEEEVESEEEAEEADEAETAPKEEQAQTKKQPGLVPGMSLTAQAETYSSYVWDELQEGDILKPGARVSGDNITVVLQANGWGSEDEVSAYDTSFTPANGLEVGENNGFIRDDEYNQRYPYANGEMVSAWVVVSYEGGEDSWDPKTITLTGYAPPPREPVTEIGSDTTLTQNINGYVTITGDVTLDLAGYTITGGGNYGTIYVNNGCTLTLKDSSAGKTGTITGGGGDTGGGVAVSENATFNMQGGTITGNSAAQGGGVYSSGTFNMSGGTISNNNATGGFEGVGGGVVIQSGNFTMSGTAAITGNSSGDYGNGGGVYFAGTTFTMSGGSITQNSGYYGAGVYMDSGTLNMSGNASISSNTASGCSGGVQVTDDATLNMSESAVIANNTAGYEGGAIYLDGTITMTGSASITGNSNSDKSAGGICVHNGTLKIGGGVKISGNTRNGSAEDVDLYPGKVITVTAALTEETPITVRRSDSNGRNYWEGVITANDGSSYTVQESDKAKFSPASSGQRVKWVDGQARLNNLYRVTYNANGATSGTVPADVNNPYESGSTVTVLGNTGELAKTGNTFNGWNTAANGSGTPYAAGATFGITGNTTLYAQWEEVPQTADVSITAGEGMTKTTDSGAAEQTGLSGAMTDVVYNADDGYYFPADYSVTPPVNGISVIRNGFTQITVSGTPTANAEITLTAATAKTTPDAPTTAAAENCTTADNNDGKLTGVTTAMEYKKSDAADWTAGTGSDITGLVPGTYYVRVKATETTNASTNQELTIKGFISYTVTFKVVNGKWSDNTTQDKTEIIASGSSLARVPTGMTADNGYTGGAWDTDPADAIITEATTFTYTFTAKQAATVTKAPEAKTLTYNSSAQELVTAGEATGGIMQYALGENATTAPADNLYTTSIPTATNAGIYYTLSQNPEDDEYALWNLLNNADVSLMSEKSDGSGYYAAVRRTDAPGIICVTLTGGSLSAMREQTDTNASLLRVNTDTYAKIFVSAAEPDTLLWATTSSDKVRSIPNSLSENALLARYCGTQRISGYDYYLNTMSDDEHIIISVERNNTLTKPVAGILAYILPWCLVLSVVILFMSCVYVEIDDWLKDDYSNVLSRVFSSDRGSVKEQDSALDETLKKMVIRLIGLVLLVLIAMYIFDSLFSQKPVSAYLFSNQWEHKLGIFSVTTILLTVAFSIIGLSLLKAILNEIAGKMDSRMETISNLIMSIVQFVVIVVVVIYCLYQLGVDTSVILTSAGVLSLIIGYGSQSIVSDLVSGIFLIMEDQIRIGDTLYIDNFRGEVQRIGLRTTTLKHYASVKVINNSKMEGFFNFSRDTNAARWEMSFPIEQDSEQVKALIMNNKERFQKACKGNIIAGPICIGVTEGFTDHVGHSHYIIQFLFVCTIEEWNSVRKRSYQEAFKIMLENGIKPSGGEMKKLVK